MNRIRIATVLLFACTPLAHGQWSTATLSTERGGIAAAAHGRYAVFAGGGDDTGPSDTVDVYDDQTGTWSTTTLTHPVLGASAVVAGDEILIAGGSADPRVNVLDTSTGLWSTATLSVGRNGLTGAAVGTKALFAGGSGTDVVDIYDAATSTWSTANLSQARASARAVTVGSQVLFAGGNTGALSDVVDIYDDSTGTWTTAMLSQPSVPRSAAAGQYAVFAHTWGDTDIYDSVAGTWSTTALPVPRITFSVGAIGTRVFYAGGDDTFNLSAAVDILDIATGAWSTATLSQARWSPVTVGIGGKLVFAGGDLRTSFPVGSDVVDVYDSYTDTWSSTTLAEGRVSMATAIQGDRLFLAGGLTFCCCTSCFHSSWVDVFTDVGASYCSPTANSLGISAEISGGGSVTVSDNDFGVVVNGLPPNRFGYLLASLTQGFVIGPGGSQGNLCLSGSIARFTQQVQNSGPGGAIVVPVDLTSIPFAPPQAVAAGETWNFQYWYRDTNPSPTSNFSDGLTVTFE